MEQEETGSVGEPHREHGMDDKRKTAIHFIVKCAPICIFIEPLKMGCG